MVDASRNNRRLCDRYCHRRRHWQSRRYTLQEPLVLIISFQCSASIGCAVRSIPRIRVEDAQRLLERGHLVLPPCDSVRVAHARVNASSLQLYELLDAAFKDRCMLVQCLVGSLQGVHSLTLPRRLCMFLLFLLLQQFPCRASIASLFHVNFACSSSSFCCSNFPL